MPQESQNKKHFRAVFFLIILAAAGFFLLRNDTHLRKVADLFENSSGNLIEIVKKEVNTPGALIARIESSRALLTPEGILSFTNQERAKSSLRALTSNALLDRIAGDRLADMFEKQYFDHISPTGESASGVAEDVGYEYLSIGENIALGNFENDAAVVAAWMDSPGHRANILNPRSTELGVAAGKGVYNGKSTWIAVQIFARPLSLCGSVDGELKTHIDALLEEIEGLRAAINRTEEELAELERGRPRNREAYNRKVDEYNNLANTINARSTEAKVLIDRYNQEVRKFNVCIENA